MPDESLFNRIKTLNAIGAVNAVEKSLRDSNADGLRELFCGLWQTEAESQWASLARALEKLDAVQTEVNPHLINNMQGLIGLCWKRAEEEIVALEHFQDEKTIAVWRTIGHLQASTIKPWLKQWVVSADLNPSVDIDALTAAYGRWWGLVQAIRTVQELSWATTPEPRPAAVEAVLMFMVKRKKVPDAEVDIFGKCKCCWRFVHLAHATGHNHLYCHHHQWNTLEYKRALKVQKEIDRRMSSMDTYSNDLHKQTLTHWVAYHQNLPENWVQLFRDDIVSLAASISRPMEYSMGILHHYFPKVFAFIGITNADWCPQQIVRALDPIPDDIQADIRLRWEALHHVFASNLALFRRELCHAEVFLGMYDKLFANVKHGGARPRRKAIPS